MKYSKLQVLVSLALLLGSYIILSNYIWTIVCGIMTLLVVQACAVYFFIKIKPNFEDNQAVFIDNSLELQDRANRNRVKRDNFVKCLCITDNFGILCTGSEGKMMELHKNLKKLIENEKTFSLNLEKACEKSILEKIQKKNQGFLENLLDILLLLSKSYYKDCKELESIILVGVKLMKKDIKARHKDLTQRVKKSGELFNKETENLQKFTKKLEKNKRNLKLFENSYEEYIKKNESYENTLKLESKIKILTNRVFKNRHQIQITKDNIIKESSIYLQQIQNFYKELQEINTIKGESHRSYIQCFFSTLQDMLKKTHKKIENFINNIYKVEITHLSSNEEELEKSFSYRNPSEKYNEIKEYYGKLDKFIESYALIEQTCTEEFISTLESWKISQGIGLDSACFDLSNSVSTVRSNLQEFVKECDFIRNTLQRYIKSISSIEMTDEIISIHLINIQESNRSFSSVLLSNLSQKIKAVSEFSHFFDTIEEVKEAFEFTSEADFHNYQCPYYRYEVEVEQNTSTQSADIEDSDWLNKLLYVYTEEWKTSSKFQTYICNKIAKKLNKDNPQFIGSILVSDFKYDGAAPYLKDFKPYNTNNLNDFYYDFLINLDADVTFHIVVPVHFGIFKFEVSAIITILNFSAKVRLFYTSVNDDQSWYSFAEKPDLNLYFFPRIHNKYLDINQIPLVKYLIKKGLELKLSNYIYPKKRSVKIIKGRPKRTQYS